VAAIVGGARLAGGDAEAVAHLRRFAERVGVAFQIADDALDAGGDDACTWLRVGGAQGARERSEALLDEALAELDVFGERAEPLRELARFCVRRSE
jgi:geranylgeranyl pyrophosphate synthase